MKEEKVVPVINGDRIIIPKKFRQKLGLMKGDFVIVRLEGKELKIIPASIKPK